LIEDILSSIESEDLAKLLPDDFGPLPDFSKNKSRHKPPRLFQKNSAKTKTESKPSLLDSLEFQDVSAFLPPGFKSDDEKPADSSEEKSSTESKSSIFDSLNFEDVSAFLPPGFNSEGSKEISAEKSSTESESSLIDSLNFGDVSAFLPPGFNSDAEKPEDASGSTVKKPAIKLDISSLLSDIKTDELGDLLPPDYSKPASTRSTTTVESTTTRLGLKFPTRPGVNRKKFESSTKATGISGPPAFVPKIKSFADRTKTTTEWNWRVAPKITTPGPNNERRGVKKKNLTIKKTSERTKEQKQKNIRKIRNIKVRKKQNKSHFKTLRAHNESRGSYARRLYG
jgi:hypothetical protein